MPITSPNSDQFSAWVPQTTQQYIKALIEEATAPLIQEIEQLKENNRSLTNALNGTKGNVFARMNDIENTFELTPKNKRDLEAFAAHVRAETAKAKNKGAS